MKEIDIRKFQRKILSFYRQHGRKLAWRETTDPYNILISEVMLQQTQVSRVIDKYKSFITTFVSFESLASASLKDVLKVWQGLGYNRRALSLLKTAKRVVGEFGGQLPQDVATLVTFSGIGPNTAGSIVAFAFNKPVVFIETNIRSVFIHEFGSILRFSAPVGALPRSTSPRLSDKSGRSGESQVAKNGYLRLTGIKRAGKAPSTNTIHDNQLLPLIEQTLDYKNPRVWYWALMDYGAHLKKMKPNPSRKSKHHTKQSRFEGSDRQLRGKIIKLLTENEAVKKKELYRLLDTTDTKRVDKILAGLSKEGLVKGTSTLSL